MENACLKVYYKYIAYIYLNYVAKFLYIEHKLIWKAFLKVLFILEYRRGFQGFLFVAARKNYAKLSVLPIRLLVVTYFLYMTYLQYKAEHYQYLYIVHTYVNLLCTFW
jgi:hypothetical protein